MPRQYSSPLREEQARRTRLTIIEAAFKLFLSGGFVETSVRAIAREARVSERTVYSVFKDKVAIVMAIADHVYYGDSVEGDGHAKFLESLKSIPDPVERLHILARRAAAGLEQGLAALARMISHAAESDARLKQFVAEMVEFRHRTVGEEVEAVLGRKLQRDERREQMIDELEAITSEEDYWILAVERNWPRERYEQYLVDMCLTVFARYGHELSTSYSP